MASTDKRERDGQTSWRVRYRDPSGAQRNKSFVRKVDAAAFAATVEADKLRGAYIAPNAGRLTFKEYADGWLERQTFGRSTRDAVALRLRLHVYPMLGSLRLQNVRASTIQAWLRGLGRLAPSYQRAIYVDVSAIFAAAVDDERLAKNPCRAGSVKRPRVEQRKVVPWPAERVLAVRDALPERYAIVVALGAGLGLRQGEMFGLSPDDVDFLRGVVHVRRQVRLYSDGRQVFAAPKHRRDRDDPREVPLPASVRDTLAAYLAAWPAQTVELPWSETDGEPATVPLIVTSREHKAMNRNYFNAHVWKAALRVAGAEPSRENGCHALRHFYASVLLDAGESIRAVSDYLGHRDPGFTLRTYTHLMPASSERTRRAVDDALSCVPDVSQGSKARP
ncbi:MAG TPA: site-specific integrase [Mycobacteriales bacterium]